MQKVPASIFPLLEDSESCCQSEQTIRDMILGHDFRRHLRAFFIGAHLNPIGSGDWLNLISHPGSPDGLPHSSSLCWFCSCFHLLWVCKWLLWTHSDFSHMVAMAAMMENCCGEGLNSGSEWHVLGCGNTVWNREVLLHNTSSFYVPNK